MRTHIVAYGLKRAGRDEPLFDYVVCEGRGPAVKLYRDLLDNPVLHSASIALITDSTDYEVQQLSNPITAMCLWEAWLERIRLGDSTAEELGGAAEARSLMCKLAVPCDACWTVASEQYEYDDPFDWEFVPAWLDMLFSKSTCQDPDSAMSTAQANVRTFAKRIATDADEAQPKKKRGAS
jgi:hypothetical protein